VPCHIDGADSEEVQRVPVWQLFGVKQCANLYSSRTLRISLLLRLFTLHDVPMPPQAHRFPQQVFHLRIDAAQVVPRPAGKLVEQILRKPQ